MTCKFCGNVIEDNSDICFICGQKVEAAPVAPAEPVAPVYAAAPAAPAAPVAPAAPAAPVYAAAPVAPAVPAVDLKAQKKALKEAKKAAKAAKGGKTGGISKGRVFITALLIVLVFALKNFVVIPLAVSLIYAIFAFRAYNKTVAAGNVDATNRLVNSLMTGACLGMAIACVVLVSQAFPLGGAEAAAAAMQ